MMDRRRFLSLFVAAAVLPGSVRRAPARDTKRTLYDAPIELGGNWLSAPTEAVARVLSKIRTANLSGVRLFSDRQPEKIHIENHLEGTPAIWLHNDRPETADIIVDIGPADWCKLAYQFGHELGHVLCNSWQFAAKPQPPTQWLEEALVEAFSIRGLGILAVNWEKDPPFAGDAGFAQSIRSYRLDLVNKYQNEVVEPGPGNNVAVWFRNHRADIETGRSGRGPAIMGILSAYQSELSEPGLGSCVDDLGALNRWPERSGTPIENYIEHWAASCREIGAPGRLPVKLKQLFQL